MASLLSRAFRRSAAIVRSRNFSELSFAAQPAQPIAGVPIKKTPIEYIADVAPIEVEATVAVCDGGHQRLGHPIEYIQLNRKKMNTPETCKYCGLRFVMKKGFFPSEH